MNTSPQQCGDLFKTCLFSIYVFKKKQSIFNIYVVYTQFAYAHTSIVLYRTFVVYIIVWFHANWIIRWWSFADIQSNNKNRTKQQKNGYVRKPSVCRIRIILFIFWILNEWEGKERTLFIVFLCAPRFVYFYFIFFPFFTSFFKLKYIF